MVDWSKVGTAVAGLAVVSAFVGPAIMNNDAAPVVNEINQETIENAVNNAVDGAMVNINGTLVEIQSDVNAISNDKILEDAWEAEAEVLAEDEFSERDYKDLFEAMDANENISIEDRNDIDKVIIRDVEVTELDADDKDAIVTHELKVYYEDADGDDKKVYMNVNTTIVDEEIFEQEITKR